MVQAPVALWEEIQGSEHRNCCDSHPVLYTQRQPDSCKNSPAMQGNVQNVVHTGFESAK